MLNLLGPAAYWLVTGLFNVFPLPRLRGYRESFAHAGEAMDRGYSILIFPEGTRSHDGKLHTFRAGIGLLAQQSRVPIVPVALTGLGENARGRDPMVSFREAGSSCGRGYCRRGRCRARATDGEARGQCTAASVRRIGVVSSATTPISSIAHQRA